MATPTPVTMPTDPSKRLKESEIRIEPCEEGDVDRIAEGLYTAFPEGWWANMEPPAIRPPLQSTRQTRLATRLRPSFSIPHMKWIKAIYTPTNEIAGIAGWMGPGMPVHNFWRRSATDFYGWQEKYGWTDEDVEEMWSGVDLEHWETEFTNYDKMRADLLGDEPHWYLAPLYTWPKFWGKGVASKLLKWAIDQADATDPVTPLYLESSPMARQVYMHVGFVPVGDVTFLRRGPLVVKKDEDADENKTPAEVGVEEFRKQVS